MQKRNENRHLHIKKSIHIPFLCATDIASTLYHEEHHIAFEQGRIGLQFCSPKIKNKNINILLDVNEPLFLLIAESLATREQIKKAHTFQVSKTYYLNLSAVDTENLQKLINYLPKNTREKEIQNALIEAIRNEIK